MEFKVNALVSCSQVSTTISIMLGLCVLAFCSGDFIVYKSVSVFSV